MSSNRRPPSLLRRALPALGVAGASAALIGALDHPAGGTAMAAGAIGGLTATTPGVAVAPADSSAATAADPAANVPATTVPPAPVSTPVAAAPAPAQTPAPAPAQTPTPAPAATEPPAPAPTEAATAAPAPAAAGAGACTGTQENGPTVQTRWGPVQVAAIVSADKTLCDVGVLQYPSSRDKSVQINSYAVPILNKEALKAQSASIAAVSGATITSDGYTTSLQGLLDAR